MIYAALNNMIFLVIVFLVYIITSSLCVVSALEYQYRNFPIIIYLESDIINNPYLKVEIPKISQ